MVLVLDIGNTNVKFALFNSSGKIASQSVCLFTELEDFLISLKHSDISINKISYLSVALDPTSLLEELFPKLLIYKATTRLKFPFLKTSYKTMTTLGVDRWLSMIWTSIVFGKYNCLVIDAGSCITYDVKTKDQVYIGGNISLGLAMRYKALSTFTEKLPLLKHSNSVLPLIGDATDSSIHTGNIRGLIHEINGFINNYQQIYPDIKIILTGGDAQFIAKQLKKSSIFVKSNLILEALYFITQFNSI